MNARPILLPLALCLLSTGCILDRTGQSATEAYRREMAIQATRTQTLQANLDEAIRRVNQLEEVTRARGQEEILRMETVDQLRGEVARLRGDLEVIQHAVGVTSEDSGKFQEDTDFRLVHAELRLAALEKNLGLPMVAPPAKKGEEPATTDAGAEGGAASGEKVVTAKQPGDEIPDDASLKGLSPDELLSLAEKHMQANRTKAARAVLERFISTNPKSERISEAHYRLGQTYVAEKEHQKAILAFQIILDKHGSSPWAPWSMLRQGECFAAMGQNDNAQLFFDDVIRLYPKSKAAKEAREKKPKKK